VWKRVENGLIAGQTGWRVTDTRPIVTGESVRVTIREITILNHEINTRKKPIQISKATMIIPAGPDSPGSVGGIAWPAEIPDSNIPTTQILAMSPTTEKWVQNEVMGRNPGRGMDTNSPDHQSTQDPNGMGTKTTKRVAIETTIRNHLPGVRPRVVVSLQKNSMEVPR
jgi:hypothetical protein